jgi:predicted transcriptional regulator
MNQKNFTCRVDEELKTAFIQAAQANDRPASVLIRDFMRDYVRRVATDEPKVVPKQAKPLGG